MGDPCRSEEAEHLHASAGWQLPISRWGWLDYIEFWVGVK